MKRNIFSLFVLIFISGCDGEKLLSPNQEALKLDTIFELKVGQTVTIGPEQISFKFESVPSDSRCPTNAVCVWEGNAVIALTFGDKKIVVNTTIDPQMVICGIYKVRLISLQPYPSLPGEIQPDAYTAKFVVSKVMYYPV